jgi:hypothetical protein
MTFKSGVMISLVVVARFIRATWLPEQFGNDDYQARDDVS